MGIIICSKHGRSDLAFLTKKLRDKLNSGQSVKRICENVIPFIPGYDYVYYSEVDEFPEMDKIMNEDLPKTHPYCYNCFKSVYDAQ